MDKVMQIAGALTVAGWQRLSTALRVDMGNIDLWEEAFDYFEKRLSTRYLNPIKHIEDHAEIEGEGFAITAIICSTIEALEAFYQGKSYRRGTKTAPLNQDIEYFKSQPIFESFLQNREPFKNHFSSKGLATEFYENVRCAILHEAATRGGWRIRIDSNSLIEQQGSHWILNRVMFVQAVEEYMANYKQELFSSNDLKEAFIRKFDAICAST
jgi:hypothetical protein